MIMIRVLGPVDVLTDDGVVDAGGHHQRKLLATLVLAANHAVSLDHLSQVLWGEDIPPSRDNTLQSHVHRLRRLLGQERIRSEDHCYELRVAPEELDALRFEELVNRAESVRDNPATCDEVCRDAMALWRGEPFGEFGDEDPFRLEALRLVELRLFAMEMRLESQLAVGRHEMVVGAAEGLVEEHPYNEKLWYLLIEALSRCGRRVDALRQFQRLTDILGDLGLEPSAALVDLEDRIVRGEPGVTMRGPQP